MHVVAPSINATGIAVAPGINIFYIWMKHWK